METREHPPGPFPPGAVKSELRGKIVASFLAIGYTCFHVYWCLQLGTDAPWFVLVEGQVAPGFDLEILRIFSRLAYFDFTTFLVLLVALLALGTLSVLVAPGKNPLFTVVGFFFFFVQFFALYFFKENAPGFLENNILVPVLGITFSILVVAIPGVVAGFFIRRGIQKRRIARRAVAPLVFTRCPKCGLEFKSNARFCSRCLAPTSG